MSNVSKLKKLREWLDVAEAARRLILFGEEVVEADWLPPVSRTHR